MNVDGLSTGLSEDMFNRLFFWSVFNLIEYADHLTEIDMNDNALTSNQTIQLYSKLLVAGSEDIIVKLKTTYADFSNGCYVLAKVIDWLDDLNYLDISNQTGTVKVYIDITYATDAGSGEIRGTNLETGEMICSRETYRTSPITRLIQDQPSVADQSD